MNEIAKCELCGEPMPQGEEMFKVHGYSGSCPKPPLAKRGKQNDIVWPDGYCLDPNGKMSIPFGKEEDFNFGYEIGFRDAWEIMNTAIRAADKARKDAALSSPNARNNRLPEGSPVD